MPLSRTSNALETKEVVQLLRRAQRTFKNYEEVLDGGFAELPKLDALPDPDVLTGVKIANIAIESELPVGSKTWAVLGGILSDGAEAVGALAQFSFRIGFHHKGTRQNTDSHDELEFIIRGKQTFLYYNADDPFYYDQQKRQNLFSEIGQAGLIPIKVLKQKEGYKLQHAAKGELKIMNSMDDGLNPRDFECELPGVSGSELLPRAQQLLGLFGNGKVYRVTWEVWTNTSKNKEVLRLLKNLDWPTKRLAIDHMDYSLQTPEALQALEDFGSYSGEFTTDLCEFDVVGGMGAEIRCYTTNRGHILELEVPDAPTKKLVEQKLGISFPKNQRD